MKYVKVLSFANSESSSSSKIMQCFDIPLNMLIPVSVAGYLMSKDERIDSNEKHFSVKLADGVPRNITVNQIIALCVNTTVEEINGSNRYNFLYDMASGKRIRVLDLNAYSWGELILKMTIAGLVYSTDDEIMEIPEALKLVGEQKNTITRQISEIDDMSRTIKKLQAEIQDKNKRISELEAEIDEMRKSPPAKTGKKRSWKRMFENIFGSSDSLSYELSEDVSEES